MSGVSGLSAGVGLVPLYLPGEGIPDYVGSSRATRSDKGVHLLAQLGSETESHQLLHRRGVFQLCSYTIVIHGRNPTATYNQIGGNFRSALPIQVFSGPALPPATGALGIEGSSGGLQLDPEPFGFGLGALAALAVEVGHSDGSTRGGYGVGQLPV